MIVLDTTVLAYAAGSDHPLRAPAQQLLVQAAWLRATTTVEVIQEFAHVHARRRPRATVARLAEAYVDVLRPLLVVSEPTVRAGLALFEQHERLGAFDCVLAAAAIERAATLVSADRAFAGVTGLEVVVPDAAGVARLLESRPPSQS